MYYLDNILKILRTAFLNNINADLFINIVNHVNGLSYFLDGRMSKEGSDQSRLFGGLV